jgi:hypothetical protein
MNSKPRPNYLRPPDRTDRAVERQLAQWQALSESAGLEAAKAQVTEQLIAAVFWFDATYGPRQAYKLFQNVADQLVDGELEDAAA